MTYNGNGNTGGSLPTDGLNYLNGATVTALGNTGTLVKTNYTYAGWNTAANGGGTDYAPTATFPMGAGNVTLYAKWTNNSTIDPMTANFDKKTSAQVDIGITMTLNGNTLSDIKNGTATLLSGTDYTISGSAVTISKSYIAKTGDFTIMVPAVNFEISCTYGGKSVDVSKFNSYVERTVAIPDGVDPTKITTGVVVEPDGTVRHVPTQVI